jgi:hypothetical protein
MDSASAWLAAIYNRHEPATPSATNKNHNAMRLSNQPVVTGAPVLPSVWVVPSDEDISSDCINPSSAGNAFLRFFGHCIKNNGGGKAAKRE